MAKWEILLARVILLGFFVLPLVGCFSYPKFHDTGRISIGPDGQETVTNTPASPKDRLARVKGVAARHEVAGDDLDATVRTWTTAALWLLGIGSTAMLALAIFSPLVSMKVSGIGFLMMGAVTLFRHTLLAWGPYIADGATLAALLWLGYTLIHSFRTAHKVAAGDQSARSLTIFDMWQGLVGSLVSKAPEVKA